MMEKGSNLMPASSSDGCPVKHGMNATENGEIQLGSSGEKQATTIASTSFWSSMFGKSSMPTNPKDSVSTAIDSINEISLSAPSTEEAARYAQTPQPDQKIHLAIERQVSSIPRIDKSSGVIADNASSSPSSASTCPVSQQSNNADVPTHQLGDTNDKWIYPSEQQMYNAMRKKGWSNIPEDSIPTVLAIHNNVNEMTWSKIVQWEGTDNIHLSKFKGRPRDISPKAFFFTYIIPYNEEAPFDRHDWYVKQNGSNSNSTVETRYVIDYYYRTSKSNPNLPPKPYIDARPALDSPRAIGMRMQQLLCETYPGITSFLKEQMSNNISTNSDDNNNKNKK